MIMSLFSSHCFADYYLFTEWVTPSKLYLILKQKNTFDFIVRYNFSFLTFSVIIFDKHASKEHTSLDQMTKSMGWGEKYKWFQHKFDFL